ncbi:MAG: fatty acid desaturase [Gammaproteobacteria bacterium]|nr:fatty acid desaturase [Gammaproteobacteria bacterium]
MKSENSENRPVEWPTLALLATNYLLWGAAVLHYHQAPFLFAPLLCIVLTLQSSLMHELIHGHPTRHAAINAALGILPLTVIYPYHLFKETHLKHHNDTHLTEPGVDPESFFHCPSQWRQKNLVCRALAWVNMTLAGRLLLSVPVSLIQVAKYFVVQVGKGSTAQRWSWFWHIGGLILVFWWISRFSQMPIGIYLFCAAVGHMLIALRAFFEHRPVTEPEARIVIVESNWFFRLLYLGNNLHAVHHRYPTLPWYRIAATYRDRRPEFLNANGQFCYRGYSRWLRYLFRPVHSPVHPGRTKPVT